MWNPLRRLATPSGANPAAVGSGTAKPTSYVAAGLDAPPGLDDEQGSSLPTRIIEFVPELSSPYQRSLVYNQMMNDAGVDMSMRATKTPVLGADYYMDPYDSDPLNIEIADFCWDNLSGGLADPLLASLEDILHMYEDGFSVVEKIYELRTWTAHGKARNTKQYTMLKDLAIRPASTMKDYVYDNNGRLTSLTQSAIQADNSTADKVLPSNKILVFTFNRKGGDITGKSLLRTAYPHWFYKVHFYKLDAVQKQRHSTGVPKAKLLPGYNKKDKEILRTMLRNLTSNEESFMILTPNVDVEFAELHGQLVDVLKSAGHHNIMILMNVMAQFLALGVGEGGSSGGGRATGSTQADIFMKALRWIANMICDNINMHLIPELVVYNYPTINFPKLCVRNIGETRDLQMLGAALGNVLSQGGLTMDDPTEAWIRRVFDMPQQDMSTSRQPTSAVGGLQNGAAPGTTPQKGATKNGKGTGNVGAAPSSSN